MLLHEKSEVRLMQLDDEGINYDNKTVMVRSIGYKNGYFIHKSSLKIIIKKISQK